MDYPSLLTNTDYILAVHYVHIIGSHRSIKLVQKEDLVSIGKVCQMLERRYVWCLNILIHTTNTHNTASNIKKNVSSW